MRKSITEASENNVKKMLNGKILYTSSLSNKMEMSGGRWGYQGNETQRREQKIAMRREIHRNYRKPFVPPPKITAKSYVIYEAKKSSDEPNVLASFNSKTSY